MMVGNGIRRIFLWLKDKDDWDWDDENPLNHSTSGIVELSGDAVDVDSQI